MDFNKIYNDNFEIVMRVAFRITGSLDIAEDICQDAFVKYLEKFGKKSKHDNVKFYLIKMVKNLSLNHEYRKKIEYNAIELYKRNSRTLTNEDSLSEIVKKEEISDIQKSLVLIPYKYRFPLILREYEGISYKEISKIVKTSESNVKVLIHRAKNLLKEKIKEIESGYSS